MSYSGAGGSGGSISAAGDAALSAPAQAQYLGYNAGLQKWQNFARPPQLVETVASANSGSAYTLGDVTSNTMTSLTLTADCALTFPAPAAGKSLMVALRQDGSGSRMVTWPGSVAWAGGTVPSLSAAAGKTDVFSFVCINGSSWFGFLAGKAF